MDFNYLTKICFPFTVFWYWLPVPYATYWVTTKDGWDLLPAVMLQQRQGNAETKIASAGGRKGWAKMHHLLFCCKLSTVCMYPKSVQSQTAQRGKPEAQKRIRPMEPLQEVSYFDQTWNIQKMSLTTGLRTHIADFCSHQYPFVVHPKRTPHCFL